MIPLTKSAVLVVKESFEDDFNDKRKNQYNERKIQWREDNRLFLNNRDKLEQAKLFLESLK